MLSVSIFNVARSQTDSLRGPVLAHYSEADRPSLMGWGGMGSDGGHIDTPANDCHILMYVKGKLLT